MSRAVATLDGEALGCAAVTGAGFANQVGLGITCTFCGAVYDTAVISGAVVVALAVAGADGVLVAPCASSLVEVFTLGEGDAVVSVGGDVGVCVFVVGVLEVVSLPVWAPLPLVAAEAPDCPLPDVVELPAAPVSAVGGVGGLEDEVVSAWVVVSP